MALRTSPRVALVMAFAAFVITSCGRVAPTEHWPAITDPRVFVGTFGYRTEWQSFGNAKLDALALDSTATYEHTSGVPSLKLTIPPPGDPSGRAYAGGALVTSRARDLSSYNALTFWAKASIPITVLEAGLGNNNAGTSRHTAGRTAISVGTAWTPVTIPIPNPSRLVYEDGLFYVAAGQQAGAGYTLWIADVQFVKTSANAILNPRPTLVTQSIATFAGAQVSLQGQTRTVFAVNGVDVTVNHMPGYFDFSATNPAVATVADGAVSVHSAGVDTITASLSGVRAAGQVVVTSLLPPSTAAPAPTLPAAQVKSVFSEVYPNAQVATWSADWVRSFGAQATVTDFPIAGHATKLISGLGLCSIEFPAGKLVDASTMNAFHMDLWTPTGTYLRVKLVDFGANGASGGGDDSQYELTFNANSSPAITLGSWVSLDVPLSAFATLTGRAHIAQIILSGDTKSVFAENIYFHQ